MKLQTQIIQNILVLFAFGCHKQPTIIPTAKRASAVTTKNNADSAGDNLSLAPNQRIYIKNCDQTIRTMERLTGISAKQPAVESIIAETKGACPTSSDPEAFDAPQIVAYQKLALEFCGEFVRSGTLREKVIDFNAMLPPTQAFDEKSLNALYREFYTSFWMGPRMGVPTLEAMKSSLDPLINELQRTAPNTAAATQAIVQGSCAAVLSASPVITL